MSSQFNFFYNNKTRIECDTVNQYIRQLSLIFLTKAQVCKKQDVVS